MTRKCTSDVGVLSSVESSGRSEGVPENSAEVLDGLANRLPTISTMAWPFDLIEKTIDSAASIARTFACATIDRRAYYSTYANVKILKIRLSPVVERRRSNP